jgi:hypothetical protein
MTDSMKVPAGLGVAGRRFWRDAIAAYQDFTFIDSTALEAAAHAEDEIVRMEAELSKAPVMIAGSAGQEKVHPLFTALVVHREAQQKLIARVVIDDVGDGLAKSHNGRALARLRWNRGA